MNSYKHIATEVAFAIEPLQNALSSVNLFVSFLNQLGWSTNQIPQPILDLGVTLGNLIQNLELIIDDETENIPIEPLIQSVRDVINGISNISNAPDNLINSDLNAENFKEEFPKQIIEFLVIDYLTKRHPKIAFLLRTLGVAQFHLVPRSGNRPPYFTNQLNFSSLSNVLDDPKALLVAVFDWGTDLFEPEDLIDHLDDWLTTLRLSVTVGMDTEMATLLEHDLGEPLTYAVRGLDALLFARYDNSLIAEGGIKFAPLPKVGQLKPGIAILPYSNADLSQEFQLGPNLKLSLKGDLDLAEGLAVKVRPFEPIEIVKGFAGEGSIEPVSGNLTIRLDYENEFETPMVLLGSGDGSRFELRRLSGEGGVRLNSEAELFVDLELDDAKIVIKAGEDGFLSKVLPPDGITSNFDLAVGISTTRGFYFRGGAGLEIKLPALKKLGPIEISDFTLGLRPSEGTIPVQIGAMIGAQIGPFGATIENMGLKAIFSFPENYDGNLGFLDLDIGFKPPNGIGLSFDTKSIKGGGYLYFDHEEKRYAGVAELSIKKKIALKAIGLLATKMPDGSKGFSLLLVISAEFEAIQLGFGFKLTGVGGIIGAHRTMKLAQLRAGIKTGANDRLLFPADPLVNAPQLISELRSVFPVEEGRFTFGLMGLIEWGTPTLITIKLGVIIEVPSPVRLAILGVLKAALPDENNKLLYLQVAFLGTIEFEKGQIAFDASLFGSKLLKITLAGDMALRISWKNPKNFLLSVGGFHPSYQPPPMLAGMQRLTMNFLGGNNPRLTLTTYFAVTSNTVQFGAKAEIYIKVTKNLTAEGHFGFDVLFQFNPFYMSLLAYAYIGLKWKGKDKMSIDLKLSLDGPTPWEAEGIAKVKILGIKFKVKASKTWGERRNTSLPKIAVLPKLRAALINPANWTGKLPAGRQLVTLRKIDSLVGLVHPVGELHISQKALPLGITIQKFGSQEVSDSKTYIINSFEIDGETFEVSQHIKEDFAPNHFRKMSESQKLSSPSFVKYKGGVKLDAASKLGASYFVKRNIKYEYAIAGQEIDEPKPTRSEKEAVLHATVKGSAAGKSPLSFSIKEKTPFAPDEITIKAERYAVVWRSDLSLYDNYTDGAEDTNPLKDSYAAAIDHYSSLVQKDPSVKRSISVVPEFEISTL